MTWNLMPPAEVCDVMDFCIALGWPMAKDELQRLVSGRFGWEIETEDGDDFLMNAVSGLNSPDVSVSQASGEVFSVRLNVTDRTPPPTPESSAFVGDQFASLVREGMRRWGRHSMSRDGDVTEASWDVRGGGRVNFMLMPRSVAASFSTPQSVQLDRKAAAYGV